jgi:phytoene/squalene synthetase
LGLSPVRTIKRITMITLEPFIAGSDLVHQQDPGPTTSPAKEIAIAQRIRDTNPSCFWSTRLLPAPRRDAMQALYFFCWELREIVDGTASRTLKLALLTDWRTQIGSLYAGRPQHFVARALSDAVDRFDLRCVDFLAIIDGMETEARTDIRAPSLEQLYLYCEQRSVAVIRIALRILGVAQADADQVGAALGRGMLLTGVLRDLTQDARRHRLYLPRELLQAHGVFATMPSYVLAQPALPQVCNAVAEWAADWFADAEDALGGRSRWRMGVVTPILSGYRGLLRVLLVRGWDHLDEPVRIPAWCRPALAIGHGLIAR